MSRFTSPLGNLTIAAPCPADWERMRGNDRVRLCADCSLNVYNLSELSRKEAEALIMKAEGRLCVRFYRRADGTVLTRNCPVGLAALKRRVSRVAAATLSVILSFFAGLGLTTSLAWLRGLYALEEIGSPLDEVREDSEMGGAVVAGELDYPIEPVAGRIVVPRGVWANGQAVLPTRSMKHRVEYR